VYKEVGRDKALAPTRIGEGIMWNEKVMFLSEDIRVLEVLSFSLGKVCPLIAYFPG